MFDVNITDEDLFVEGNTRNYRKKLAIGDNVKTTDILKIDDDMFDGVFSTGGNKYAEHITEELVAAKVGPSKATLANFAAVDEPEVLLSVRVDVSK